MKALARSLIAVAALSLFWSGQAPADEWAERSAIHGWSYMLFRHERFAELEALSAKYRTSRSRTPSGLWHLTLFYSGLAAALSAEPDDDESWEKAERSVKDWIAAYPRSPSARLAYAEILDNRAWSIRGSGFAHTVKPENWKPFEAHMERARAYLEKIKKISSADPYWYQLMADVAMAQGWPPSKFDALLWEGLKREPHFYELYFAAIRYYAPRWHGNDWEIEIFARKAVEMTRATEGAGMYARIYWYASQYEYGDRLFANSLVVWPNMKKGIDDVLGKYPDRWNINNFARFACLYRDKAKSAELIARIGDAPMPAVWGLHPARRPSYEECRSWASN